SKLALLLIDMQNDFLSPEGMMAAKKVDMRPVRRIIEPARRVADGCRRAGVKVIYTQHVFRPDFSDLSQSWASIYLERPGTVGPGQKVGPPGESLGSLVRGTWNAAIIPELVPQEGDIVVDSKHTYTAFYQTDLELILRKLGIETLLIGGVTTAVCVESTLRDAFFRGFRCVLLKDCTWEKTPELQAASETIVKMHFGMVTTSAEVLKGLRRQRTPGVAP
ncbi:MAG: rutB 1, partial [Dehalococcoidia bacterium]|nr:rutB 1 [Dehalococcoidia bacterium]